MICFKQQQVMIAAAMAGALVMGGVALAAGAVTVSQKGLAFSSPTLTIARGTIVTFSNDDTTSHNILVSGNGVNLNSGLQTPGTPFRAPFLKAGSYSVICGIHPKMHMTVNVN